MAIPYGVYDLGANSGFVNWRGQPLTSPDMVVRLTGATATGVSAKSSRTVRSVRLT